MRDPNKVVERYASKAAPLTTNVGCQKMEQVFKEIVCGLLRLPFLPMTLLFSAEVTFGVLGLKSLGWHAIALTSVASLRILSIVGLLLLEFLSRQFHWSGGNPGLEGMLIIMILFVTWVVLSLVSLGTFAYLFADRVRRNRESSQQKN